MRRRGEFAKEEEQGQGQGGDIEPASRDRAPLLLLRTKSKQVTLSPLAT
jgi:hypothetical protein